MTKISTPPIDPIVLESLQRGFEEAIPTIEKKAKMYFRGMDPDKREEMVADTLALGWKYYLRLHQTGKNPDDFISPLGTFTAKQVAIGRRLTGQLPAKDVSPENAVIRKRFFVSRLPDSDASREENELFIALTDNRRMSPADGAAFKIDYESWRERLGPTKRQIAEELAAGGTTNEVAASQGKSPARISQVRKELADDWNEFQGGVER